MDNLINEPNHNTPYLRFDFQQNILEIKGRSSSENSLAFYQPVIRRLDKMIKEGYPSFLIRFTFEYFNNSTSKCLFDILKRLKKLKNSGTDLTIQWYYEKDDIEMLEAGEDFANLLDLEFIFLEVEEI